MKWLNEHCNYLIGWLVALVLALCGYLYLTDPIFRVQADYMISHLFDHCFCERVNNECRPGCRGI